MPSTACSGGMPGCVLYTDVVVSRLLATSPGPVLLPTPIPPWGELIGLRLFQQAFVLDPPANPRGVTVTNCRRRHDLLALVLSLGAEHRRAVAAGHPQGQHGCGVYKDFLILRLGEQQAAEAFKQPGVRPLDITGKPMKGWVMIAATALRDESTARWIEKARAFAMSLPAK